MNSTQNSSCSASHGDLLIIVESILLIIIALLSQFFNLLCFRILTTASSGDVPNNVKVLLAFCNVAYLIRSFVIMTKALYNFYLITNGFDSFQITKFQCIVYEYFYLAPCMVVYLSTLLIGLERLRKTIQTHARDHDRVTFTKILCSSSSITISVTILYAALAFASDVTLQSNEPMCYCYVLLAFSKNVSYIYTAGAISIQIISCLIYFTVYKKNRKILDSFNLTSVEHDLSDRFIKNANIKACHWLTPVTLFHAATVIGVQLMATIIRSLSATGSETVGYIETVVASVCIFGFEAYAHPILCIK
uniref:Vomeronasal type-1 receptor n=1 Tax=Romanomermis culicivorax TaxID=13658 RepID=A0A915JGM7_ROMCU